MIVLVTLLTFLALLPLVALELFIAMIVANGYMGNTDPMVTVYLLCMGSGLLAVSLLAGLIARVLAERFSLSLWLAGFISLALATLIQPGLCLVAFFIAITFFAP